MAGLSAVERRLKLPVLKRVKKLRKLRRRMRLWGSCGALLAVTGCGPLLYYLFSGSLPAISFDQTIYISDEWAVIAGTVLIGWLGSMLFYGQYKRDKDKFDKIRAGAVELIKSGDPICECKWTPCSCKDELIGEMNEHHDINLSY